MRLRAEQPAPATNANPGSIRANPYKTVAGVTHTPTDNAEIERYHRTIGERIEEQAFEDYTQAKAGYETQEPELV